MQIEFLLKGKYYCSLEHFCKNEDYFDQNFSCEPIYKHIDVKIHFLLKFSRIGPIFQLFFWAGPIYFFTNLAQVKLLALVLTRLIICFIRAGQSLGLEILAHAVLELQPGTQKRLIHIKNLASRIPCPQSGRSHSRAALVYSFCGTTYRNEIYNLKKHINHFNLFKSLIVKSNKISVYRILFQQNNC